MGGIIQCLGFYFYYQKYTPSDLQKLKPYYEDRVTKYLPKILKFETRSVTNTKIKSDYLDLATLRNLTIKILYVLLVLIIKKHKKPPINIIKLKNNSCSSMPLKFVNVV
jgi:hypothetical protein